MDDRYVVVGGRIQSPGKFEGEPEYVPTFWSLANEGGADWDVLVSITYRDWAAIQEHSDAEIARRLYPDQETFKADEAHRFSLLDAHWDVVLESRPLER